MGRQRAYYEESLPAQVNKTVQVSQVQPTLVGPGGGWSSAHDIGYWEGGALTYCTVYPAPTRRISHF